jgi:hypothetical protein
MKRRLAFDASRRVVGERRETACKEKQVEGIRVLFVFEAAAESKVLPVRRESCAAVVRRSREVVR